MPLPQISWKRNAEARSRKRNRDGCNDPDWLQRSPPNKCQIFMLIAASAFTCHTHTHTFDMPQSMQQKCTKRANELWAHLDRTHLRLSLPCSLSFTFPFLSSPLLSSPLCLSLSTSISLSSLPAISALGSSIHSTKLWRRYRPPEMHHSWQPECLPKCLRVCNCLSGRVCGRVCLLVCVNTNVQWLNFNYRAQIEFVWAAAAAAVAFFQLPSLWCKCIRISLTLSVPPLPTLTVSVSITHVSIDARFAECPLICPGHWPGHARGQLVLCWTNFINSFKIILPASAAALSMDF